MKIKLTIAELATLLENYKKTKLIDNKEILISDLNVKIPTPRGLTTIDAFIKKENLPILTVSLSNGYTFKAAKKHLVQSNKVDVYLEDLKIGDKIDHQHLDSVIITSIAESLPEDCFDVAIESPHTYYDANGVIHHNTIVTATLAKVCEKYGRTITIVPNKSLVEQTEEDFVNVGLDVGVYYGDRKDIGKTHTIATWQSLNILEKKSKDDDSLDGLAEFLDGVNCVIVDEVHMAKADVLKKILTQNITKAPVRWGLTGTVPKEDFNFENIRVSIGNVVGRVHARELQDKGVLSNCHVNIIQTAEYKEFKSYPEELKYLVTNKERMAYVSGLINKISENGNTLILIDRIECGNILKENLSKLTGSEVVFVSGSMKTKDRKEEYKEVAVSNDKIIIATYGVAAVGINIPRIFNLVLIEPGKSFVRVIQSIGRGIRKADDKDFVQVWDITGSTKRTKQHLTERKRFYKEAQYPFTIEKVKYD